MSAGHAHALYLHGDSRLHRLAPEVKLAALVLFVVAVVITPRHQVWAFGAYALICLVIAAIAGVPGPFLLKRLAVTIPFLLFAALLPFIGGGEQVEALGLSRSGLWAAWNIAAKALLGATASVVMAATTPVPEILAGLDRLHTPAPITAIAGFMVRYLDVVGGELRRMRMALAARGYDPRWWGQARVLAATAGTLFVRSYERGERVYRAMAARGYSGRMPRLGTGRPGPADWALGALPVIAAWTIAAAALVIQ